MQVVLQEVNIPNRNGRIYPKKVVAKALDTAFIKEKLSTNSLLGEGGHPVTDSIQRQGTIDQNNVTHVIKGISWDPQDSNILLGEVESAGTSCGKDWAGLIIENGMIPSFSMRGMGDVMKSTNGTVTVKDPLRLITYDSVNFPSHQKAYMRSLREDCVQPVMLQKLAEYAASRCKDLQQLNEEVMCLTQDKIDFALNEKGQLAVIDKSNGRTQAIMLLETSLNREVDDALKSLLLGR